MDCMQFIRPVAVTMSEQILALEKWALTENRTILAESTVTTDGVSTERGIDF